MERNCEICGVTMPRGSGIVRDDVANHMRVCGRVGLFVCPYCGKHSAPLRVALNMKNLSAPKHCRFCERRVSLTNDSGLFEESEMVEPEPEPEESKRVTREFSEPKVEAPEKPKKKVFRWSEQK